MASKQKPAKPLAYEAGGAYFSPEEAICHYLQFIPADHENWFFVLCGIAKELGNPGRSIAEEWSKQWDRFEQSEFESSWKSALRKQYGRDMGVLRKLALDNGYQDDRKTKPAPPLPPDPKKVEAEKRAELKRLSDEASAAGNARALLKMAKPCQAHAYLKVKGVEPAKGLKVIDATDAIYAGCKFGPYITKESGRLLLVPVMNEAGEVQSVQAIAGDGRKGYLQGAKMSGGYFVSGDKAGDAVVYLVEGLATGLSIYQATAARVHVAFDAGNLKPVAEITRRRFPEARIIIAGDLDEYETGQKKARAAAAAVNGLAIFPDFTTVEGRTWGDWNDLHQAAGLEVVTAQINAAMAEPEADPAPSEPAPPPVEPSKGDSTPNHFRVTTEQVEYINPDGHRTPICGALRVLARVRNEADFGYGLHVEFKTLAGHTRRLVVNESLLEQPQELRKKLADAGLWLNRAPKIKGWLIAYLSESTPTMMALSIEWAGWYQGMTAHVCPGGEILHTGSTPPALVWSSDPPDPSRHGQRGTLEQFQQHQGRYCVGNPVLMFSACVAFSAKILAFVRGEGGIFHIWGEPGKGKTTGQYLMVSVDAPPGAKGSWEGTFTSYGQRMPAFNDNAVALDEIKMVDEKYLDKISYLIGNGHDKSRSKEGLGLAREATWLVYVLSSGEMAFLRYLGDHVSRVYGGQETRCIDLKVDGRTHGVFDELHGFTTGAAFAEEIERVCGLYYGTAGREFVRRLMASYTPERIKAFAAEIRKDFELHIPDNSDSAIYRAAKKFAHVAVGGELAIELGIVPWAKFDALQAALDMFELWIKGRGGIGNRDRMEALKQIRHYLLTHEEDQFTRNCPKCQGSGEPGQVKLINLDRKIEYVTCSACAGTAVMLSKTINKAGWVKQERNGNDDTGLDDDEKKSTDKIFYIYPEVFDRDIARGHDTRTVLELLKSRRILRPGNHGPFKTKARPLHELGAPYERSVSVYVINLDSPGWEL